MDAETRSGDDDRSHRWAAIVRFVTTTPTERVTQNAREFVGPDHDVVMALRVEWGLGTEQPTLSAAIANWSTLRLPLVVPLRAIARSRATKRTMFDDRDAGCGILALTSNGGHILLSAMPLRRKIPTGFVDVLPDDTPLLVDVEWMENYLVPRMTVGEHDLVVDGVDFKALLEAVEDGSVTSPELAANLHRLKSVSLFRFG